MKKVVAVALFMNVALVASTFAQSQSAARQTVLDSAAKQAIVDQVSNLLTAKYVFLDTARKIEDRLRQQLSKGAYSQYSTPREFADAVNKDLADVGHDKHMRFTYDAAQAAELARLQTDNEAQARYSSLASARRDNFGFRKVEWLPGNVGYLDFREFYPAADGGASAVAALNFLAHCDAVIIDLRQNGGGDPSQIQLISSYFFLEPTHLNDMYFRATGRTDNYWTLPFVPGQRMTAAHLYILTSRATFSAAEEFSYNMKNLKRATLVGETTGGGAHETDKMIVQGDYVLRVPVGRAINPISKTNWEGTGVVPDVQVPAGEAFGRAYAAAIEKLRDKAVDSDSKREYEWILVEAAGIAKPVHLDEHALQSFVGEYGDRKVVFQDGVLLWQRGAATARLRPLTETLFAFEGRDDIRIEFTRKDGAVVSMAVITMNGGRTAYAKIAYGR